MSDAYNYKYTNYPKLYENVYWGKNCTVLSCNDEVIRNRNNFVSAHNIKGLRKEIKGGKGIFARTKSKKNRIIRYEGWKEDASMLTVR